MGEEKRIEIEQDIEAEHVESTDYYFHRIGKPIPIAKDNSNDSPLFQLETPPSQPLALSLTHRLIFVAHSSGFYVARTNDVMDAAKDMEDKSTCSSIQQLCLVDVPLSDIRILSVSSDSSTLAVSAAHSIHFFSIDSLINKDVKPAFSDSLPEATAVKDFKWTKASQTSYLVLSDDHKLFHAALHSPLKHVLDDVDAVDWSVKGKFIAVARDNFVNILFSKFKERLRVSLPFKSWIGDSDDKCTVRVDSISWVRHDSIVVGCFQQTADDMEENYLLQVIKSTDGKITDASCKPLVLSFHDLFPGLIDDVVPNGTGPYLFLSYLEQCGLALAANRKNTDQHVVLLGWSINNDTSEVAAIDIERDGWLPRIELQDNGDDNLIMGLCVDKVSLYEKVKVEVGVEEQKELSPYCVLICVTFEGMLVMFHVASVAESATAFRSALDDDEEDILEEVTEVRDESSFLSKDEHEAPSVSRQLGNFKEMVKELDMLLDSIEGAGGFKDACTGCQRTSVESLEEGMKALSGKTRMSKSVLDDRIGVIQNLLDKTVQVLARKIYIDGIIKQASDNQYWELWNRQKLSSELELKRSHISELNQDLTNRLIELERHFNTLELNNFGENGGSNAAQRAPQGRYRSSRNTQSLYSLHNAVSSQLEAAEKLSECLSQQMAALSAASPVKRKSMKKELFETIGIPYDASFSSPDSTKVGDNLVLKKLQLSNGSAATKDHSRRRQSSSSKNSDAETARRRRDSLDQSLVSFEPTRTTVKRVLLRESQKTSVPTSSPRINRQHFDARILDKSAVTHQGEKTTPSTFLYSSSSKAANELPMTSQNSVREAYISSAEKSRNKVSYPEKFDSSFNNGMKPLQQSEISLNRASPTSMALPKPTQFTPSKLVEMPNPSTRENWLTSSAAGNLKDEKTNTNDLISKSVGEKPGSSFPLAASMASNIGGKTFQFAIADGKGQAGQTVSSSTAFSTPVGVSSSFTMSSPLNLEDSFFGSTSSASLLSTTMPFGSSLTTSKAITDAIPVVSSTSSSSISSFPVFSPSSSPLQTSGTMLGSVNQPSVSESSKTQVQPLMAKVLSPGNLIAAPLKPEVQPPSAKPAASPSATGSSQTGLQLYEVQPPSAKLAASPSATGPSQTGLQPHTGGAPSSLTSASPEVKTEPPKIGVPPAADKVDKTDTPPLAKSPEFSLNLESSASSITTGTGLASVSQSSLSNSIALNIQPQQSSSAGIQFGSTPSTSDISSSVKNDSLDVVGAEEDEMEEEASETSQVNELNLGSLGGFSFGSTPSSTAPRGNPFGGPFGNAGTTQVSSPFTMSIPNGELFKPASFSLQSPQPPQPSLQTQMGAFSGGFGTGTAAQPPTQTGFGQPSQIGQQALGSVLGSFGQSRQIGTGLPGIASPSGFGTGFSSTSSIGGFSSAATGGGFANLARSGAGFSGVASGGGGFGAMASGGGGFAGAASGGGGGFAAAASGGGGFAGAASGAGGGGFGGYGSQQGAGGFAAFGSNTGSSQQPTAGFSSFGSNAGGTGIPAELFTQMRK